MIQSLSNYAKGLIYVIIIIGILELILPNNKNKKYIKVIMGMFVIFSIISPIAGKSVNIDNNFIEKYMNASERSEITENSKSKENTIKNDENLKSVFKDKAKESIKEYLKSENYDCKNILIETENYEIKKIKIVGITKNESNSMINKIEINIKDENKNEKVSDEEIQKIKDYISKNYGTSNIEVS